MAEISAMFLFPILNARISGFSLAPWQTGHGRSTRYSARSSFILSVNASSYRLFTMGMMPSNIRVYCFTSPRIFSYSKVNGSPPPYIKTSLASGEKSAIHGQVVMFKQCPQLTHEPAIRIYRKWPYGPLAEGYVLIWHHPIKIHFKG